VGARVVVLGAATPDFPVPAHQLGTSRDLLVGDHAVSVTLDIGPALPLTPLELMAVRQTDGAIAMTWRRRSHADPGTWSLGEPPLEYVPEAWRVEIMNGGSVLRTLSPSTGSVTYGAAEQTADFGAPPAGFAWSVAQVSPALGPGHKAWGEFHD
jgi:hypothetical protein